MYFITVFLTIFQGRVRVVLICRPKLMNKKKPVEKAANIEEFGQIIEKMLRHCNTSVE